MAFKKYPQFVGATDLMVQGMVSQLAAQASDLLVQKTNHGTAKPPLFSVAACAGASKRARGLLVGDLHDEVGELLAGLEDELVRNICRNVDDIAGGELSTLTTRDGGASNLTRLLSM